MTRMILAIVLLTVTLRMVHGAAAVPPETNLDKSGTTARQGKCHDPQPLAIEAVADRRSFETERAGFEPAVGCDPYNGLASRRDRPLCHLSGAQRVGLSYLHLTHSIRFGQDWSGHFRRATIDIRTV